MDVDVWISNNRNGGRSGVMVLEIMLDVRRRNVFI